MKYKNWSKAGIVVLILVCSFFLPYVIRDGFHYLAVKIEGINKNLESESEEVLTETESTLPKKITISGNLETESHTESETALETESETEQSKGDVKDFLNGRKTVFETTLIEYLKGITQTECTIEETVFKERYESAEEAYHLEVTFIANDKRYTEKLICEYDTEFDFFRLYPENFIE